MWGTFILARSRYDAMRPPEQFWAAFHLVGDAVLALFFVAAVCVGLFRDANAFFVLVPLLALFLWVRFKQTRRRWSL